MFWMWTWYMVNIHMSINLGHGKCNLQKWRLHCEFTVTVDLWKVTKWFDCDTTCENRHKDCDCDFTRSLPMKVSSEYTYHILVRRLWSPSNFTVTSSVDSSQNNRHVDVTVDSTNDDHEKSHVDLNNTSITLLFIVMTLWPFVTSQWRPIELHQQPLFSNPAVYMSFLSYCDHKFINTLCMKCFINKK